TCTSPQTFANLANGDHTFKVRATDAAGNAGTATRAWFVDLAPPETSITTAPPNILYADTTAIVFAASRAGSTFECSVNGSAYAACSSPFILGARLGSNTFSVRATGPNGITDDSPATTQFWSAALLQNG